MPFSINGETFDRLFFTDTTLITQYIGTGKLWTWGYNSSGQLGDNSTAHKSSPVQTIAGGSNWKQGSAGTSFSASLKTDGTLWLWGYAGGGQLGTGNTTSVSSPVQTICGGTNWSSISCGYYAGAVKTDGTLWLWGDNTYGGLGDNTIANKSSPVQTICGGTTWVTFAQVSRARHAGAIKTDGTLWMWGRNNYGQLGDNTNADKSSPVQTVAGGTNWKYVACGSSSTAAIKTDGTLWLWGFNGFGGLGDNSVVPKSSPVQTICGGTNWSQVSPGSMTGAVKTDGTLWMCGYNGNGHLGDGTITNRSSPVQTVCGGTNWKQVSIGTATGAIKTDGTLWMWGYDAYGALGGGTPNTWRSSPIQTIAGGVTWRQVSCGYLHTLGLN
jgi:alpha-tubulin suppressor-like RCC1 family protein